MNNNFIRSSTHCLRLSKGRQQDFNQVKKTVIDKIGTKKSQLAAKQPVEIKIQNDDFRAMMVEYLTNRKFNVLQTKTGIKIICAPEDYLLGIQSII